MSDGIATGQLVWCSYCHAAIALSQQKAHEAQHKALETAWEAVADLQHRAEQRITVLERQAQQLLERVSQLEAGAAWKAPDRSGKGLPGNVCLAKWVCQLAHWPYRLESTCQLTRGHEGPCELLL